LYLSSALLLFSPPASTPPETSTLSLHDALPISVDCAYRFKVYQIIATIRPPSVTDTSRLTAVVSVGTGTAAFSSKCKNNRSTTRSEEHTSELQSRFDLVCRLLLEKKKKKQSTEE